MLVSRGAECTCVRRWVLVWRWVALGESCVDEGRATVRVDVREYLKEVGGIEG